MNVTYFPSKSAPIGRKARVRLFWLKLHRWVGLTLLLVMFTLGFTGAVLVWPDWFDSFVHPARYPAASTAAFTPDEDLLRSAYSALPEGDVISGLRIPQGGGAIMAAVDIIAPPPLGVGPPVRARVWLHPQTGEVLDSSRTGVSFLWIMKAVHGHLLLDEGGREAVAIAGLFLLFLAGTGIWLWWPGRRAIWQALKYRKQFSLSMNLHRQTGAVLALVILVEAVTGIYVTVPLIFAPHGPEGPPPEAAQRTTELRIEDAVAKARALADGPEELQAIFMPTPRAQTWQIAMHGKGAPVTVRVDDRTGRASIVTSPPPDLAHKIEKTMTDIHFGQYGILWQIAVFVSGVILSLLSITGLLLWSQGRARRPKSRRVGA